MKIPKQFELLGKTITVKHEDTLLEEDRLHGRARFNRDEIALQTPSDTVPIKEDSQGHDFFHELTHWVFYLSGIQGPDGDLWKNENVVDLIGGLYHQAFKTMSGEVSDE
jgi:hypothetical protein